MTATNSYTHAPCRSKSGLPLVNILTKKYDDSKKNETCIVHV